jgi:peptidyl-prolyl cis-trans isomerase C
MTQPFKSITGMKLLCIAALFLTGCEKKATTPSGPAVLARVGDQVITADDLKLEVARLSASKQSIPEKSVLLQQLVDRLSLVERAKKLKLNEDYETRRTMDGILISKLREKELDQKISSIEVSDEELQAAYKAEQAKFVKSAKVRLAILFQESHAKMSEAKRAEIRQRMEEGLQKAQSAELTATGRGPAALGFGAVAINYSEEQTSRLRGGDIGWLDVGNFAYQWPKQVLETGYALEKGKLSGIIETDKGLYVVMKTDARESAATPFNEASAGLRRELMRKKHQQIEADFLQETARVVKTEIDQPALATIEIPSSPKPASLPTTETPPPTVPGVRVSSSTSDNK